jgi:hypothetical protein
MDNNNNNNNNNNMDKNESLLKKCRPPQGMYQSMFFWGVNFTNW